MINQSENSEPIIQELTKLNLNLAKQNSLKLSFLKSVVQGIGSAVGAVLIAGIAITILYQFILTLDPLSLIQKIFPQPTPIQSTLQQLFNSFPKK